MASMAEVHQISDESAMEMGEAGTNAANGAEMADNPARPSSSSDQTDQGSDKDSGQGDYTNGDVKLQDGRMVKELLQLGRFLTVKYPNLWDETFLRFDSLETSHIHHLQEKILGLAESPPPWDMKEVGEMLHQYSIALRDYEYMRNLKEYDIKYLSLWDPNAFKVDQWPESISVKQFRDGVTKSNEPLPRLLNSILPTGLVFTKEEFMHRNWTDQFKKSPPHSISPFVDRLARFIVAFVGGLSLVLPMIIMRIHQNTTKSIITTSVAVLLFAATVSVLFKASNSETLGITAAYAAVLVVFVGTSG